MELDSLDEVTKLKERRGKALALFNISGSAVSLVCRVLSMSGPGKGSEMSATQVISPEPILAAIMNAAGDGIVEIDKDLAALGVTPPKFIHPALDDVSPGCDLSTAQRAVRYWRDSALMFSKAWARELGPRVQTPHFIDELVIGTRKLRAKATDAEILQAAIGVAAKMETVRTPLEAVVGKPLAALILVERDRLNALKDKA